MHTHRQQTSGQYSTRPNPSPGRLEKVVRGCFCPAPCQRHQETPEWRRLCRQLHAPEASDRQTGRQAGRQAGRQTDRQQGRQAGRMWGRSACPVVCSANTRVVRNEVAAKLRQACAFLHNAWVQEEHPVCMQLQCDTLAVPGWCMSMQELQCSPPETSLQYHSMQH